MSQPVVNTRNDVPTTVDRVEPAAAIFKAAFTGCELYKGALFEIERANQLDCRSNFLPICPHILNRCAAHCAGNAGQALNTRAALRHYTLDKSVPVLAGGNLIDPLP